VADELCIAQTNCTRNPLAQLFSLGYGSRMKTASDIIDAIGRNRIMAAYGVKARVLQHHAQNNRLPALWFDGLEKMAGQPLPRHLFAFKEANQ